MKEIGTFKIDKNMCSNCGKDEKCPQKYSVNGNCLYIEKDLVKEQEPETWEDLKELCEGIKEKLNKEIWEIKIEDEFIYVRKKWETKEICFTSIGNMVSNNGWDLLMTNLTPARQWQIIKNLIGEQNGNKN